MQNEAVIANSVCWWGISRASGKAGLVPLGERGITSQEMLCTETAPDIPESCTSLDSSKPEQPNKATNVHWL